MPDVMSPSFITIVCPLCGEARYRSRKPFVKGDFPTPSDFEALGDSPPLIGIEAMPMCHACGAAMEPKLETVGGSSVVEQRAVNPRAEVRALSSQPLLELVRLEPNETVLTAKEVTGGLVIVTTRRIFKVNLG